MLTDRRGQEFVAGFMMVIVFVLVAAGLSDLWRLQVARQNLESVAYEAALRGVSRGRDWNYASSTGMMRLSSSTAQSEAQSFLTAEMSRQGLSGYSYDIRVLPDPTGGTQLNYPPMTGATAFGATNWTTTVPAVGVYVSQPVSTMLFGLVNGNAPVTLHAFGAAEAQTEQ